MFRKDSGLLPKRLNPFFKTRCFLCCCCGHNKRGKKAKSGYHQAMVICGDCCKTKLVRRLRPKSVLKVLFSLVIISVVLLTVSILRTTTTQMRNRHYQTRLPPRPTHEIQNNTQAQLQIYSRAFHLLLERQQHLQNVCEKDNTKKLQQKFVRNTKRHWVFYAAKNITNTTVLNGNGSGSVILQWCPVFKAASTPWMAIFSKLGNFLTNHTEALIHSQKATFVSLMRDFRMNIQKRISNKAGGVVYNMIIVRHPFERLLSAYRDKLERVDGREYYHRKYGHKITKSSEMERRRSESMYALIANILKSQNTREPHKKVKPNYKPPTFREFVEYLFHVDSRRMDEHWIPAHLSCKPCSNKFDLILKVESMANDRDKVLSILGIHNSTKLYEELNDVWKRWTNHSPRNVSASVPAVPTQQSNLTSTSARYFSQLSAKHILGLYKIYELDFRLFNYSPDEYYRMAGS